MARDRLRRPMPALPLPPGPGGHRGEVASALGRPPPVLRRRGTRRLRADHLSVLQHRHRQAPDSTAQSRDACRPRLANADAPDLSTTPDTGGGSDFSRAVHVLRPIRTRASSDRDLSRPLWLTTASAPTAGAIQRGNVWKQPSSRVLYEAGAGYNGRPAGDAGALSPKPAPLSGDHAKRSWLSARRRFGPTPPGRNRWDQSVDGQLSVKTSFQVLAHVDDLVTCRHGTGGQSP